MKADYMTDIENALKEGYLYKAIKIYRDNNPDKTLSECTVYGRPELKPKYYKPKFVEVSEIIKNAIAKESKNKK